MLGYMAINLAALVAVAPASLSQDSRVLDQCKPTGAAIEAEEAQQGGGRSTAVLVAMPIGGVCVGPELLDGEPSYVRRTTEGKGVTIVEVSTTPFMPELPAGVGPLIGRPDQPASW